eukprot:3656634-Amphidinium_carterae.1
MTTQRTEVTATTYGPEVPARYSSKCVWLENVRMEAAAVRSLNRLCPTSQPSCNQGSMELLYLMLPKE